MFRVVLLSSRAKFVCRVPNQTNRWAFTKGFSPCQWVLGMDAKSRLGNPTDKTADLSLWTPCSTTQHSKDTRRSEQQPRPRLFWQTHHFVSIEPCRGVDDVSKTPTTESSRCLAFSPTFKGSAKEDGLSVEEPGRRRKTVTRVKYAHFLMVITLPMSCCHVAAVRIVCVFHLPTYISRCKLSSACFLWRCHS